jgi:activating signal cointegrator complex subunit 2
MDKIPAFVPFPEAELRHRIAQSEWRESLNVWIVLAEAVLSLPDKPFETVIRNKEQGVIQFCISYVHEHSISSKSLLNSPESTKLHKTVYLLCHRSLLSSAPDQSILSWTFLSDLCLVFAQTSSLKNLLSAVWKSNQTVIQKQLETIRQDLIPQINKTTEFGSKLKPLTYLIRILPPAGQTFAVGSDLLDSLVKVYSSLDTDTQKTVIAFVYFVLLSLMKTDRPNHTLLSTHLYTLRVDAQQQTVSKTPSLLSTLVSDTNFLKQLSMHSSDSESEQAPQDLAKPLLQFQIKRPKQHRKSKGRVEAASNRFEESIHIHKMSLIIQVQDLFPDLGSGYVAKLLDFYNENIEQVTEHLLDDSLPPHLASADRSEQLTHETPLEEPNATLPIRHNIHDNDDFDSLSVSTAKLHIGKSENTVLDTPAPKAAILAALAAFDADDDERDDTYDDFDHAGSSIDASSGAAPPDASANTDDAAESFLFGAWKANPAELTRSARFTSRRQELKKATGWTDEAIEGFAIMMNRDPNREKTLQRRFPTAEWTGEQKSLERSSWQQSEDAEAESSGTGHSDFNRRGRGRGGRGGAPSDTGGDSSRTRKNKEVRGNQRRREGHAKKMARGMA